MLSVVPFCPFWDGVAVPEHPADAYGSVLPFSPTLLGAIPARCTRS